MPSHFDCIGFPTQPDLYFALIDRIAAEGVRTPTSRGEYVSWNAGFGPETWLHLQGNNVL